MTDELVRMALAVDGRTELALVAKATVVLAIGKVSPTDAEDDR